MKSLLYGMAALPFLATVATADPVQLSSNQMDKVTAGWSVLELDRFNTGATVLGVYTADLFPPTTDNPSGGCGACYLNIRTPTIQLYSWKPATIGEAPPF